MSHGVLFYEVIAELYSMIVLFWQYDKLLNTLAEKCHIRLTLSQLVALG
jgi:hypothetical protein